MIACCLPFRAPSTSEKKARRTKATGLMISTNYLRAVDGSTSAPMGCSMNTTVRDVAHRSLEALDWNEASDEISPRTRAFGFVTFSDAARPR
jgi:hypothetical protein